MNNFHQQPFSHAENDIKQQHMNNNDSTDFSPSNNNTPLSPYSRSPWSTHMLRVPEGESSNNGLMGSLVREEGHIYSLATSGDLIYTGSDSKNIRVWKNQREYSGFNSNSGLVKSIVISGDKIFTGHQDGKIRVWKMSSKNPTIHKRIGTLPTFKAFLKSSVKPSHYIDIGKKKNKLWLRHLDAISSLCLSEDNNFIYSASWDKTIKVWRVSNFKCLESIPAHDDAVNSVVAGFDGLVFTGSADGTVKVWRREVQGKGSKHFFSQFLLKQECAVTALAVDSASTMVYCGSSDGHVNFWVREGLASPSGSLKGHKLAVLCLSTAGSLVFSGSADTNICVWKRISNTNIDNSSHICLSILTGHNGPVKCLAVVGGGDTSSLDAKWILYSGSLDKSIKLWRIFEDSSENAISDDKQKEEQGDQSFNFRTL